jgi:hypothetical protein
MHQPLFSFSKYVKLGRVLLGKLTPKRFYLLTNTKNFQVKAYCYKIQRALPISKIFKALVF